MAFEPDSEYNRHNHFQTFLGGLLVLFRWGWGKGERKKRPLGCGGGCGNYARKWGDEGKKRVDGEIACCLFPPTSALPIPAAPPPPARERPRSLVFPIYAPPNCSSSRSPLNMFPFLRFSSSSNSRCCMEVQLIHQKDGKKKYSPFFFLLFVMYIFRNHIINKSVHSV